MSVIGNIISLFATSVNTKPKSIPFEFNAFIAFIATFLSMLLNVLYAFNSPRAYKTAIKLVLSI